MIRQGILSQPMYVKDSMFTQLLGWKQDNVYGGMSAVGVEKEGEGRKSLICCNVSIRRSKMKSKELIEHEKYSKLQKLKKIFPHRDSNPGRVGESHVS